MGKDNEVFKTIAVSKKNIYLIFVARFKMELGIQGRWALVTGSSKGLGFGCAQALAREGVNLVVNGRSRETLNIACEKLKRLASREASITILGVEADITTPEGRDAVFDVKGGPGRDFDILVTNSGGPPMGDFREWDRDIWLAAIEANMFTPIELIKDGLINQPADPNSPLVVA